jgi:hypothetical protein
MSSLLVTINQTPGLLDQFKNICAGASGWAALTPPEKSLFEHYKQALVA